MFMQSFNNFFLKHKASESRRRRLGLRKTTATAEQQNLIADATRTDTKEGRQNNWGFTVQLDAYDGDDPLHPKGKHAGQYILLVILQQVLKTWKLLTLNVQLSFVNVVLPIQHLVLKETFGTKKHFYSYKMLPSCSRCGTLKVRTTFCKFCKKKRNQKQWKFHNQEAHVLWRSSISWFLGELIFGETFQV